MEADGANGVVTKVCTKCKMEKELKEFNRDKKGRHGTAVRCRECQARYYEDNKEKVLARVARYREENKDKIAKYRQENKDKAREWSAKYYQENKDRLLEELARYYQENKTKVLDRNAKWRQENKGKVRECNAKWYRKRVKTDPAFRCKRLVSSSVYKALKSIGYGKARSVKYSLPYTMDELYQHLVSTIPEGYTEADFLFGKLHIDHAIPHCTFNYTTDSSPEFLACWSLSNLRLIPAEENLAKNDLVDVEMDGKVQQVRARHLKNSNKSYKILSS